MKLGERAFWFASVAALGVAVVVLLALMKRPVPQAVEQGFNVNLPKASAAQLESQSNAVTVCLAQVKSNGYLQGVILVDQRQMDIEKPFDDLRSTLDTMKQKKPKLAVIIRADKDFKYDAVIKILDVVRSAGITTLSLATQAE